MDPNQIYAVLVSLWLLTVAGFVTRVVRMAREHERKQQQWDEEVRKLTHYVARTHTHCPNCEYPYQPQILWSCYCVEPGPVGEVGHACRRCGGVIAP